MLMRQRAYAGRSIMLAIVLRLTIVVVEGLTEQETEAIRRSVFDAIAQCWPELRAECHRQMPEPAAADAAKNLQFAADRRA